MSAVYVTRRTCVDCKAEYTFVGWQLSGLCPACGEKEAAKVRTNCSTCNASITPARNRTLCDACFQAETVASVEKWGNE